MTDNEKKLLAHLESIPSSLERIIRLLDDADNKLKEKLRVKWINETAYLSHELYALKFSIGYRAREIRKAIENGDNTTTKG